jgi:transmembrane sensor
VTSESQEEHIAAAAAQWDARLRSEECSAEVRAAFDEWLRADPAHARHFHLLQQALARLHEAGAIHPRLRAMRDAAVSLRRRERFQRGGLIAASLAVLAIVGWIVAPGPQPPAEEAEPDTASVLYTAAGERTQVRLADGSEILLDTRTRLEVRYSRSERSVQVLSGRAYFKVGRDPLRPFVVSAADQKVVAVGTEFDVRLDERRLAVTLVEGRVDVGRAEDGSAAGASTSISMFAGEQLLVDLNGGGVKIAKADIEKTLSWRQGKIFFEDMALSDAVAEMNRYSDAQIVLSDPSLGDKQINGMFYTGHPTSFLVALEQYFGIRAHTAADGTTYLVSSDAITF